MYRILEILVPNKNIIGTQAYTIQRKIWRMLLPLAWKKLELKTLVDQDFPNKIIGGKLVLESSFLLPDARVFLALFNLIWTKTWALNCRFGWVFWYLSCRIFKWTEPYGPFPPPGPGYYHPSVSESFKSTSEAGSKGSSPRRPGAGSAAARDPLNEGCLKRIYKLFVF